LGIKHHLERSYDDYSLQNQVDKMKEVFNYCFDQINIPAFFDSHYKKSAYEGMTQEDILRQHSGHPYITLPIICR